MSAPVVESSSTYTATSVGSIVNTKPSGLAVGDYLLHYCWYIDGTATGYSTPTDWTSIQQINSGPNAARRLAVFGKVADADDVAASNFTVNIGITVDAVCGILLRISNFGQVEDSEADASNPVSATVSFTGALTPVYDDTLVLLQVGYRSGSGLTTVSSYSTTPSNTFTEIADIVTDYGSEDPGLAVAYATTSSTSEITAYGATLSGSKDYHVGSLILITPQADATGTNALLSVSPTHFNQNGRADTHGSSDLLEVSPTLLEQSGSATAPTQWANEAKPTDTSWTNESK